MLQNFIYKDIEIFTSKERPFSLVSKTVRHLVLALLEVVKKPCQRRRTKNPTERKYILLVGFFFLSLESLDLYAQEPCKYLYIYIFVYILGRELPLPPLPV
jgi:hypothetical protein